MSSDETPKTTKAWTIAGKTGFDSLKYHEDFPVAALGDRDVLVKMQGVSLNYRDLIMPMGKYGFPWREGVVPCSDGAGEVVAVGSKVSRFSKGDKVVTLFNQEHLGGALTPTTLGSGLGGSLDGTLRAYAPFPEHGLVRAPSSLSAIEASTLPCAGLTAWNALHGLSSHAVKAGDWVLTQGTGGVSIFAVQFAKAAGARVIATTSSLDKAKLLEKLGADHIINYKDTPEWGAKAKEITGDRGVDHIVEVAGPSSMAQSLTAIAIDGVISIIGFVGGGPKEKEPGFLQCLANICVVRGILVGSRVQLEEMVRAIDANVGKLRPVVDGKVFGGVEEAREAYEYMWGQGHQGNVCIKMD